MGGGRCRANIVMVVMVTLRWFRRSECSSVANVSPLSDWMSNLPPGLQTTPLKYLAIPGSHDSGSYSLKIEDENIFPLKYSKFIHMVNNITGKGTLGEVIYRWSKTQDLDISQQLLTGVRYFDLRVAVDKNNKSRIVHGLLGGDLDDIVQQFKDFLQAHPHEVVLVDISNIHRNRHEEENVDKHIIDKVTTSWTNLLCPPELADKSLHDAWAQECQIFVFYNLHHLEKKYGSRIAKMCSKNMVSSPFDLKTFTQPSKWMKFLEKTYAQPVAHFHVIQGIMEPHWMEIAIAGLSETASLKEWVSEPAVMELVKWLRGKRNGKKGVNIVMADFVESHDFVGNVIALNTVSVSRACDNLNMNLSVIMCIFILLYYKLYM